ncbi:YggS family pyridoxal phosphate-dependent enzyme [Thalassobacillus pellis]|uniref:YggS family pyridoxal phosphate-dependent enzyme n=1 Tax=Thalassobacillus pellis TaxID=748008 RepID=UPI001961F754|nr:YggS family pyridoxal phosphate-dependent enzyme [Thalassobacillus pellis]MBM7552838.1 pyridoxal phosphate enzyme (YggS family) [Thalassobacillus pellis]
MSVMDNWQEIRKTIGQACENCGRDLEEIKVVAVTKYVTIERAREALAAGVSNLGENRMKGFLEKYEAIGDDAVWHFIGSLQSRKVKDIIDHVDYIHSLDRKSLAKEINKRAKQPVQCFVQVNVSGEESKHGLVMEEVEDFIETLKDYPNIKVIGLMTMAPHVDDEELLRGIFRKLRALRDKIRDKQYLHAPCKELSMGMSNDYRIAIEEGSTFVRIGSSLVGQ